MIEYTDTLDIDTQIKHYEQTLKNVRLEYDKSMIHEWSKIREKALYYIREITRLRSYRKIKWLHVLRKEMIVA